MKEQKQTEKRNNVSKIDQKRRMISRAGMVTPLIMSLVNKTALGQTPYHCTVSGAQSGNVSSHPDTSADCGVGFSPGAWKQNASRKQQSGGGPDGNIQHWLAAGVVPFDIRIANGEKQIYKNGTWKKKPAIYDAIDNSGLGTMATLFSSIFGGSSTDSVWQVLKDNPGSFEFHAIADYLNAKLNQATGEFSPVYDGIDPADIVALYQNSDSSGIVVSSFTTSTGYLVPAGFDARAYLESIHH